jgi:hypothetical protein
MQRRRPGFSLLLSGLIGLAFFLLTDARWGFGQRLIGGRGDNPVDLANALTPGTLVGLGGSAIVLFVGLWLTTRRAV